jgi:predicted SnoaL-like aldol condensation-catalyzing enzyme
MKKLIISLILSFLFIQGMAQNDLQQNKKIANDFYRDLWFTNNTQNYHLYVADTFVVHDIGERKSVKEPAIQQKRIADFFWRNGNINAKHDFQIAEGDLVATRWIVEFEPKTLRGKVMIGKGPLAIVNILRIKDGKIVEFWNHRHDIDTPMTLRFVFKGLAIGLLISLIPLIYALRLRRKLRRKKL